VNKNFFFGQIEKNVSDKHCSRKPKDFKNVPLSKIDGVAFKTSRFETFDWSPPSHPMKQKIIANTSILENRKQTLKVSVSLKYSPK